MSKRLSKALTIGGLLIVFAMFTAVGSAQGQSLANTIRVNIPFDFVVGNKKLPAGQYSVVRARQNTDDTVLAISSRDSRVNVFPLTIPVQSLTFTERGKLIFHRYGDQYFLFQIWPAGAKTGRAVPKSRTERELEQRARDANAGARKLRANETVPVVITGQ